MQNAKLKPKRCKNPACKKEFAPVNSLQKVCSAKCAIDLVMVEKAKKERKLTALKKVDLRSRRDWLKLAQTAVNGYVRERDKGKPCISCGRHHDGQYHAGHYLTTAARPDLRFDTANIHLQCQPCNHYKSGNVSAYRPALIRKIGQSEVARLEGPAEIKKWTIEELKEICVTYKAKLKELKQNDKDRWKELTI